MLGKSPAKLLDDLEPVGLRALRVVRPQVDVHEPPAEPIRHLRAQPVHIVVVAGNRENGRTEDRRPEHLPRLEVVGDEHATLQPETRGVRRHAVGEIAGRRAGQHVEPELHGARRRDRHDAVLVGQRRMVDRIVLDIELADAEALRQPAAADQRREAGMKTGLRLAGNRQQLPIAPEVLRPPLDLLPGQLDRGVVVDRLERAEAPIADVDGFGRKHGLAEMTLQSDKRAHTASASLWSTSPLISFGSVNIGAGTIAA